MSPRVWYFFLQNAENGAKLGKVFAEPKKKMIGAQDLVTEQNTNAIPSQISLSVLF